MVTASECPARGQVGGGELVARAERIGMLRAADVLGIGEHALEDGHRAVGLAGRHQRVAQAELRFRSHRR